MNKRIITLTDSDSPYSLIAILEVDEKLTDEEIKESILRVKRSDCWTTSDIIDALGAREIESTDFKI